MNSFIHSLISYRELEEEITPKLLELDGFKDFLYNIDVTFGSYKDSETGKTHVVIKCDGNEYTLMAEFADGKFESMYKQYPPSSKKGQAFEVCLGRALLEHFAPMHCMDLTMHWGKNELEMGGEK